MCISTNTYEGPICIRKGSTIIKYLQKLNYNLYPHRNLPTSSQGCVIYNHQRWEQLKNPPNDEWTSQTW